MPYFRELDVCSNSMGGRSRGVGGGSGKECCRKKVGICGVAVVWETTRSKVSRGSLLQYA